MGVSTVGVVVEAGTSHALISGPEMRSSPLELSAGSGEEERGEHQVPSWKTLPSALLGTGCLCPPKIHILSP